jgi:hypothetical protein
MIPEVSTYTNEAHLQELLAADPTRIPGVRAGSRAVRELSTSKGPIDICVVDPTGSITVVECKLHKNSESRRTVIGQVLHYASALRADGPDAFRNAWSAAGGGDLLGLVTEGDLDVVANNLEDGRINLCLAVDKIDEDLKQLVEYLYLISADDISVVAIELAFARHGDVEILIPTTFGAEIALVSTSRRGPNSTHWTWPSFIESLADVEDRKIAEALHQRLESVAPTGRHPKLWFGARPKGAIFFHIHGERYAPFQMMINSAGRLCLSGNWNWWPTLEANSGFEPLAGFLGQDHSGARKRVLASSLDLEIFWEVAVETDRKINS